MIFLTDVDYEATLAEPYLTLWTTIKNFFLAHSGKVYAVQKQDGITFPPAYNRILTRLDPAVNVLDILQQVNTLTIPNEIIEDVSFGSVDDMRIILPNGTFRYIYSNTYNQPLAAKDLSSFFGALLIGSTIYIKVTRPDVVNGIVSLTEYTAFESIANFEGFNHTLVATAIETDKYIDTLDHSPVIGGDTVSLVLNEEWIEYNVNSYVSYVSITATDVTITRHNPYQGVYTKIYVSTIIP